MFLRHSSNLIKSAQHKINKKTKSNHNNNFGKNNRNRRNNTLAKKEQEFQKFIDNN